MDAAATAGKILCLVNDVMVRNRVGRCRMMWRHRSVDAAATAAAGKYHLWSSFVVHQLFLQMYQAQQQQQQQQVRA